MEDFITTVAVPILMGLIPAFLAKKKGRNFYLWWLYGWLFFVIATIHALLMKDKSEENPEAKAEKPTQPAHTYRPPTTATARRAAEKRLAQYKVLLDQGILTKEEYQAKKLQLLGHK